MLTVFLYNRFLSIASILNKITGSDDPELIHELRVEIKKTRAVYSFLKKLEDEKLYDKNLLGHIFKDAGLLRELQLHIMLLKDLESPVTLINELEIREAKAFAIFKNQVPQYLEEVHAQERSMILPVEKIKIKKLRNYFDKLIEKGNNMLNYPEDPKDLHEFRKLLKKIMYILESLPERLRKLVGLDEKYISELQKKAGEWHDSYVSWQFLQTVEFFPEDAINKIKKEEQKKYRSLIKNDHDFEDKIYA